jgi:L-ascorbate metabolism protein UlaG (beta-lactamase superfamily)
VSKKLSKMILYIAIAILLIVLGISAYIMLNPEFGASPSADDIEIYIKSDNWKDGEFKNLEHTSMAFDLKSSFSMISEYRKNKEARFPKGQVEIEDFNFEEFANTKDDAYVWFGHSVILLKIDTKIILSDPMFGYDASPVGPFTTKRFSDNTMDIIDKIKHVDYLLLTHDHYDHLDYKSILKLDIKVKNYLIPLGVDRHLIKWNIDKAKISTFDWWNDSTFDNIKFTFTPTRHFSGRGLSDRNKSLWGGWAIEGENNKVFISGDGGYGKHFKEIGERFDDFDLSFIECGQYNPRWHQIHMYPEESVQAAIDVNSKHAVAIHWNAFVLALHSYDDPIVRFEKEADLKGLKHSNPKLGKILEF